MFEIDASVAGKEKTAMFFPFRARLIMQVIVDICSRSYDPPSTPYMQG